MMDAIYNRFLIYFQQFDKRMKIGDERMKIGDERIKSGDERKIFYLTNASNM